MADETAGQAGSSAAAATPAQAELKFDTNPVTTRSGSTPNLRFQVLSFYTDDPDLWFFKLEAMFMVNRITTEQDKYAVVVANFPYSIVQRIPRNLVTEDTPYSTLKELVVKETDLSDNRDRRSCTLSPPSGTSAPATCWPASVTCSQCRTAGATAADSSSCRGCCPSPGRNSSTGRSSPWTSLPS